MPLIKHFEEIQGWQEARKLVQMIYLLTNSGRLPKTLALGIRSSARLSRQ